MANLKQLSEFQLAMTLREWARNHDIPKERVQEFIDDVLWYTESRTNKIKN